MYGQHWKTTKVIYGFGLLALVLIGASPVFAQVQVGDNLKMSLNGNLGAGYAGTFGNFAGIESSHGLFLSGQGDLSGSYYDPKFLSFFVQPYYNRNQDNGSFGSVFSETGVNASVNLFGGSHFPGSVSYGRSLAEGNQFGLPGTPGLTANGYAQTFAVAWNAYIPHWPTLTASYTANSNSDTIIGETGTTDSNIREINLLSNYRYHGFDFFGNFTHQNYDVTFPEFLTGSELRSLSSGNSYSASVNHALPLQGNFLVAYTHTSYDSKTDPVINKGNADSLTGSVGLNLTTRFALSGGVQYYNNLIGALQGSVLPPGSQAFDQRDIASDGVTLNVFGTYNLGHNLILIGYANRQMQHFADQEYSNNQFGGTLTYSYSRPLLGMLYFSFGMVNTAGNGYQGTLAAVGNLGFKKTIRGWEINADGSYAQNVQSSIALFTTSNFGFGAYVRRRFGETIYWTASGRHVQTGITQLTGYSTGSDTYMTSIVRRYIGISGSYSQSHGTSVLTASGALVPTPFAPIVAPGELVYDGTAYGGTFSITPLKRMAINTSWYRLTSSTASNLTDSGLIFSNNDSNRIYSQLSYKFRKLDFLATYWRVNQLVSASGLPRTTENNYSFTISRWFNVF